MRWARRARRRVERAELRREMGEALTPRRIRELAAARVGWTREELETAAAMGARYIPERRTLWFGPETIR